MENLLDDDDPYTYKEAMEDVDCRHWKKAMQFEIESMFDNKVWSLVDLPKGIKPIGCKWVYKRKRGMDGNVETFKARLVAKGYTQKDGTITRKPSLLWPCLNPLRYSYPLQHL